MPQYINNGINMKKGLYITIASLVVLGGTIFTIAKVRKNRAKRKEEFDSLIELNNANNQAAIDELKGQYENALTQQQEDIKGVRQGKFAYPSGSYVNIRTSAKVNNGYINNIKYKHTGQNKKIGMIKKEVPSVEYGDKKTWYMIELEKGGTGYAREDVITVKNS